MKSRYAVSALLLGAALIATTPSDAAWRHGPVVAHHAHVRFAFHHDFHHFSPVEHRWWVGGHWRHAFWHGRRGWWWGVGGAWYFYDAPVYPYPSDVSPTYYDEDQDSGYTDDGDNGAAYGGGGGPGGGSWYHCANPNGYYPYVQTCRSGWEQVPAQPSDMQGGPGDGGGGPMQGGPGGPGGQYGPGPGPDDQGPPPPPGH